MTEKALALKRIQKDLEEMKKSAIDRVMLGPSDDSNLFHWEGMMKGPDDSLYAGGIFKFVIDFPNDYPMEPPKIMFTTKIYHPNISDKGEICVDILEKSWSAAFTISKLMISISSLLTDPYPDSALNVESSRLYQTDRKAYNKTVKEWVKKYASPESL